MIEHSRFSSNRTGLFLFDSN